MSDRSPPLDLESLLRAHYHDLRAPASIDEHSELSLLATALTPSPPADVVRRAARLMSQDPGLAEAVLLISGRAQPRPRRAWLVPVTAFVAAAAATLVLVVMPGRSVHEDAGASLTPKGAADTFDVAVQRGDERFRAHPGDHVVAGDRLGFFYTSERGGYLAVIGVDERGNATALHPASGPWSAAIEPAEHTALPSGAVVEAGERCDWIVAIFSDAPLPEAEVRAALARSPRSTETCIFQPQVPGARAVRVVPLAR
ncbi:DUF4384 domain-containing protein [Myxococcota bacterium]|nr:DUF4384 domain-containing protein [Myxococcota bacterium]